jgi:transcriptional regulator with XRE-family HTH domain
MLETLLEAVPGLTATRLAKLAGMPASTVTKALGGETSPTLRTLQRLAEAVGFELDVHFTPIQDEAVLELLTALGEGNPVPPRLSKWESLAGTRLESLLRLCSLHAQLERRQGSVWVTGPEGFRDALGIFDGAASRHRWLVSGTDALDAAQVSIGHSVRIFYTDQIEAAKNALTRSEGGTGIWLLPLTTEIWSGRQVLAPSERWVSPYRALGDVAAAIPGRESELAQAWMEATHG